MAVTHCQKDRNRTFVFAPSARLADSNTRQFVFGGCSYQRGQSKFLSREPLRAYSEEPFAKLVLWPAATNQESMLTGELRNYNCISGAFTL
jgi:hypothetical protein